MNDNSISKAAFLRWFKPILTALKDLGGSGKPGEVRARIIDNEHVNDEELQVVIGKSNTNKFANEVAWARNYLVMAGYVDKSVRGLWSLTDAGYTVDMTDELASEIFKKGVKGNKDMQDLQNYDDSDVSVVNTWLFTWNPAKWNWKDYDEAISSTKLGKGYCIGWNCANRHAKIGDRVFMIKLGDPSTPRGVFASGYITSDFWEDDNYDESKDNRIMYVDIILTKVLDYKKDSIIPVERLKQLFPEQTWSPQTSGIAIRPKASLGLLKLWDDNQTTTSEKEPITNETECLETVVIHETYSKDDFLNEVFVTETEYGKLRSLILKKKNIILQGAPGVGKTYSAKRLAYSIIGEKNDDRICMVQFHQNYSYEDFIMGYRPNDRGGFDLQEGIFYDFCEKCKDHPEQPYFFIIDEINRGNLSKIFGELLMLIETDKRGEHHKINLVYGGTPFYIPDNLHIIGMMNTADRSLAMIDYALRRRFSFYTMQPAFDNADTNGFSEYAANIACEMYHTVITKIEELNNSIRTDSSLGKGFEIGHSYFAPENKTDIDDEWVRNVVEYEIIPLIEEYWFDDDKKIDEWKKALYQALGEAYDG